MEKSPYVVPAIEVCEVMIESSFATSPTGADTENLSDGGSW